jgi:hypothetical protein
LAPDDTGGSWHSGDLRGTGHRTNTFSNDDVALTISWDVSLAVRPGTSQVVIKRTVDFDVEYTHWYGIEGHAVSASFRVWYHVPLVLTVSLIGAVDGTLQVAVTSQVPQPAPNTSYDLPQGHLVSRTEGTSSIWVNVADALESTVDSAAKAALAAALPSQIETTLANTLNLTPFVFPGGAQLSMIDPLFTDAGDLLFGVSHKS